MRPILLSVLILAVSSPVSAQVTPATLLSKMESFGAYAIVPMQLNNESHAGWGVGYEIALSAGTVATKMNAEEKRAFCERTKHMRHRTPEQCADPKYTVDTTYAVASVRRGPGGVVIDTTFTVATNPDAFRNAPWLGLEVAVANQVTRIRKVDVIPGWSLSGKIEEFPAFTIYGTINPKATGFSTYIGPRLIIGKLDGARIAQGDSAATVSASATGGGIAVGQVIGFQNFNFFGEVDWSVLRFATGEWRVPGNMTAAERAALPTHLALTGFRFSAGLQISLTK